MKMLMLTTLFFSSTTFAETIISTKTVTLPVKIDHSNMKLSRAGYSREVLKVFIPALADVTILDHRNLNSAAPCMSTFETHEAEDVIQDNPALEKIDFKIEITKGTQLIGDECKIDVTETITGKIRGFNFSHKVQQLLPDRHQDDCR